MAVLGGGCVLALLMAGVFFIGNHRESEGMDKERDKWITQYIKKPYCESSTSGVRGKEATVKRCWKVIEVND